MFKTSTIAIAGAVLTLAACGHLGTPSAAAPAKLVNGAMVAPNGMTLYTFDKDTVGNGKSACNGPCAALWPPFAASSSDKPAGDWGVVTRDDGAKQWSYKGKPLYFYQQDKQAGDRTGDKFRDVWHIIKE